MNQDPFQEETIDLKKIFFKYVKYWYLFAVGVVLALAVAWFVNRIAEPVYRVESTLLISDKSKGGMGMGAFMGELDMFGSRSNFHDQLVLLTSHTLIDSTLRRMNTAVSYYSGHRLLGFSYKRELFDDAPFRVAVHEMDPDLLEEPFRIRILNENTFELEDPAGGFMADNPVRRFGEMITTAGYQLVVQRTARYDAQQHQGQDFLFVRHDPRGLVDRYVKGTLAEPLNKDAWIIRVSYEATHLDRALTYLNTLTGQFISQGLSEKNEIAANTLAFIEEQIRITNDSLRQAESSLQEFRQQQQLLDVSAMSQLLLTDLQSLDEQKAIEEVKHQYYDYLLEYIREEKDFSEVFGPSAIGINDPLLNALITEISRLYGERGRLLLSTTDRSPQIQALDQMIGQARRSLEENITSIRRASQIMLTDLDERIQQIEQRIRQLPKTERELIGIQRKFNLNDATFNYLLEKRAEAGIAMASNIADNKIVDEARFDAIVGPRTMMNYAIALVMGLALPLSFLVIRSFFNTTISDKSEVTDSLDFPILGVIPHHEKSYKSEDISLVALENLRSPIMESFRAMRTNLQFFVPSETHKIVAVTSTQSGEGKSFTSMNLALVLAMSGKKTILVGADMRKPKISREFSVRRDPGLSGFLIGKNKIEEIIQPTSHNPNLWVITAGQLPPNPSELIESAAMDFLLEQLKDDFDYVILDTAPVGMVSDALTLLKKADLTLYVIRQNFTQKVALDFIHDMVQKTRLSNICLQINGVKNSGLGYKYGYGVGYGYGQGYYEKEKKKKRMIWG